MPIWRGEKNAVPVGLSGCYAPSRPPGPASRWTARRRRQPSSVVFPMGNRCSVTLIR